MNTSYFPQPGRPLDRAISSRGHRKLFLVTATLILTAFLPKGSAATITAVSPNFTDVQSAVASAVSGDTVAIPAGTATWTTLLTIPTAKILTIRGQGDATTIIKTTPGAIFSFTNATRITGLRFELNNPDAEGIRADGIGWRVDHITCVSEFFNDLINALGTVAGRHPVGLVDHCTTINCRMLVNGSDRLLAHEIWNQPSVIGTANCVYIENCDITFTVFGNAIDSNYGGMYVFRYNRVTDASLEAHSFQSFNSRGAKSYEIYENDIIQSVRAMNFPFYLRTGTGVVFNNRVTGTWSNPGGFVNNIRSSEFRAIAGYGNGGSLYDGNTAVTDGTGTHNGGDGQLTLIDTTKAWSLNGFLNVDTNFNMWVYNVTAGSSGQIVSNLGTVVTAVLTGGSRTVWNNGDSYLITNGYPARDQPGRGRDLTLAVGQNLPWPTQALEPIYYWNNRRNTTTLTLTVSGAGNATRHILAGRDYFTDGTQRPGYTPYTYPHPLVTPPTAPSDLRIVP